MSKSSIDPELAWKTLLDNYSETSNLIKQWMTSGKLSQAEGGEIIHNLQVQREAFQREAAAGAPLPHLRGFLRLQPRESPGVRGYRVGMFVTEMLRSMRSSGKLSLAGFHVLQADAAERLMSVRQVLVKEGISEKGLAAQCTVSDAAWFAEEAPDARHGKETERHGGVPQEAGQAAIDAATVIPSKPRRGLMEIVLDPRSIQCLLGLGGALMVVGLVILLWANNYFTPPVMAIVLALSNLMLVGMGLAILRFSRYQMAGKALSLLSCLVMPLNLWYLHSNNLITIDGHLWVCAVLISAVYGLSAVVLKDELFVYVFSAGVAMTGLLILADWPPSPATFWEISSPATLLVLLGLIGINLERAFAVGEGPFNRAKFGMAFFWSGHVQLAAGLIMVLAAQLAGDWMFKFWFQALYASLNATPSPICGELRWLALCLVVGGTYAYTWSDLVVRKKGIFLHVAACTLLWAEVLIVQLLNLSLGIDAIIAVLAITSLVSHVAHLLLGKETQYTRTLPVFGLLLGFLPVLMGVVVYLDHFGFHAVWDKEPPRWAFVGAMLLTAVACRAGAYVYRKSSPLTMSGYFFATAAATMVAAVAALAAWGKTSWQSHAPIMMLIPLVYMIASRLYGTRSSARPLLWVAHSAAAVMLLSSLASAFRSFTTGDDAQPLHLPLALFFAEAAVFYGLATWFRRQPLCVYLSSLMTCAAFWQLLSHYELGDHGYILAFGATGLLMLIAYRLSLLEQTAAAPFVEALFQSANAVLSLAFLSSIFLGLSEFNRNISGPDSGEASIQWGPAGFSFTMLIMSALATLITRHPDGRRWYTVTTIAQACVTLLAVHQMIELSPWQQVELFSVITGLILLCVGHVGWYREQDQQSDVVSMSLLFGSILVSVPLAIATLIDRNGNHFIVINEFGFLFVSVALLATGILFQLKSTAIVGSGMTMIYFLTLIIFVPWERLDAIALTIAIGGGILFGSGLLLAFFRDRLLTLPSRIQQREGIFRVFTWR